MLRTTDLTKRFGGITATDHVDFELGEELTSLIGPNGAGKTTFFDLLTGALTPSDGTVEFKQNGEWVGPEGEPLSFTYAAPPWEGYQTAARYKAQIFSRFGMPTETKFQTGAKFWESMDGMNKGQNTDAWDMIEIWFIGAHPSGVWDTGSPSMGKANWGAMTAGIDDFQFNIADKEAFQNTLTGGEGCEIVSATPEMRENRGYILNAPIRNEIPAEIGAMDTSGETMTSNLIKWDLIASQSNDEERVREVARKQAWYMNYQAQKVTTLHEVWGGWGNSRHFKWMHELPGNTEQNEESAAVKFNKHARERTHGFVRSLTESEFEQ